MNDFDKLMRKMLRKVSDDLHAGQPPERKEETVIKTSFLKTNKAGKTIRSALPRRQKKVLLQVRIDEGLLCIARQKRKKDGVTWRVLIEALLKRYMEEND